MKQGTVYKITKVDTRKDPWIFQLTDVMGKKIAGYYYAAELMHVPDMKVLKYLKFKKSRTGKKLGLARFKGYPRYVIGPREYFSSNIMKVFPLFQHI